MLVRKLQKCCRKDQKIALESATKMLLKKLKKCYRECCSDTKLISSPTVLWLLILVHQALEWIRIIFPYERACVTKENNYVKERVSQKRTLCFVTFLLGAP